MAKKKVKKKTGKKISSKRMKNYDKKTKLVIRQLIFFGILFIASLVGYMATGKELLEYTFGLFTIVFGSLVLAFILVLLTFFFMKVLKKKK